jgi:RNA-binding protein
MSKVLGGRYRVLTGKQKRFLRSLGNEMVPILQVGKGGIAETVVAQADEALEARELIKGRVLPNSSEEPKTVAAELAEQTGSELVQVIGRNFLLFRQSKNKPGIDLPN